MDTAQTAAAPGRPMISRRRLIAVDTLITLTTVLAAVVMMPVWANCLPFGAGAKAFRQRRQGIGSMSPDHGQSMPDQLERLAALQASGAITDTEYDAAKRSLLRT